MNTELHGNSMLKLSIIGCGNVAKTMGYLWHQSASAKIVDVVNRSQASANESIAFIGAGRALSSIEALRPADLFVIACGDDHIEECLDELLAQDVLKIGTIIFHFSGAKSSTVFHKAKKLGAKCASLHPVKSFAKPTTAIKTFENTYCGLEGDNEACIVLEQLIKNIGGHCFNIDPKNKLIYHSASVFACNYLVALQEMSIRALEKSGIERDLAMNILEPIVKETSNNIFKLGSANALTGPIARGDSALVEKQFAAIKNWNTDVATSYKLLGKLTVEISNKKGVADKEDLELINTLFK